MIRNAFAARTDTLSTWGVLQKNCLLIKAEEKRAKMATEESMLTRRLREIREAKQNTTAQERSSQNNDIPDYLRPVPRLKPLPSKSAPRSGPSSADKAQTPPDRPGSGLDSLAARARSEAARPCWLTISASQRHITLPATGELVLGRFDPHLGLPPDIDLAYEDANTHSVSRRHAKIVGVRGYHTIEDLGSSNGLFLNGEFLATGPSRELRSGDQIKIGDVDLTYEAIPVFLLNAQPSAGSRPNLIVTATGRKFVLAPSKEYVIGRSDRYVDLQPDIDLNPDGEVASRVSRRHAVVTWRGTQPYVEDLGSGFGTRLNGETLLIGQAVPLKPGDHLWLGGCVLAYELTL
jgi:pSer/pThr/pTyr-binding forkhead associated (FHA) protein